MRGPGALLASLRVLPASREVTPGQEATCLRPQSPELAPPLTLLRGGWCSWLGFFFLNHFYKNQPVAQLQQGRAWGPAQPLPLPLFPTPTLDPREQHCEQGLSSPTPKPSFPGIPGGAHTITHRPPSEPISFVFILSFRHERF
ncbi:unnamed protein product [Rangifer tarandus platyrhynchus]|uniref:Uncharacterized protein n=1 Tax=Rangifer tarandus platyrhynchus TaxID=3082113 RepID=A0AC59YJA9_RANTA